MCSWLRTLPRTVTSASSNACTQRNTYGNVYHNVFPKAKNWKQCKKIKELWHIHEMEHNKAVNMNELKLLHQHDLKIMLSEKSEGKIHKTEFISSLKTRKTK